MVFSHMVCITAEIVYRRSKHNFHLHQISVLDSTIDMQLVCQKRKHLLLHSRPVNVTGGKKTLEGLR